MNRFEIKDYEDSERIITPPSSHRPTEFVMNRSKSPSVAKGRALQPLQSLQSGISSLSLDEAFAAVNLAKLKLEAIAEQQKAAASTVASAKQIVEEAEARLPPASITLCTTFIRRDRHPHNLLSCSRFSFLIERHAVLYIIKPLIRVPRYHRLSIPMCWSRNESATFYCIVSDIS